jgi:hypothetical protein
VIVVPSTITPVATLIIIPVITPIKISSSYNVGVIVPMIFPILTEITPMT